VCGGRPNAALIAISMADLTAGVLGAIISTMLIVVLGEIVPQAACSRHGLLIGASTLWLVKIFLVVMFPIAWPISLVLDRVRTQPFITPAAPCAVPASFVAETTSRGTADRTADGLQTPTWPYSLKTLHITSLVPNPSQLPSG